MGRSKDTTLVGGGRYKLGKSVCLTTSGEIYEAEDVIEKEKVAVKFEDPKSEKLQLIQEYKMYKIFEDGPGIATIRWFGREKAFTAMVLDFMEHSLRSWFKLCGNKFTLKTVCMICLQGIDIIQFIHSKKYIHRDIKPENFLTGVGMDKRKIFIVDFSNAIPYVDENGAHKPDGRAKEIVGTCGYASINCHLGNELSRRDDMESFGYMNIFLAKSGLPWSNITGDTAKERFEKLTEAKQTTTMEQLCEGLPPEFAGYMNYIRSLRFEQEPDYNYCKSLFEGVMKTNNYEDDGEFDWVILMSKNV